MSLCGLFHRLFLPGEKTPYGVFEAVKVPMQFLHATRLVTTICEVIITVDNAKSSMSSLSMPAELR